MVILALPNCLRAALAGGKHQAHWFVVVHQPAHARHSPRNGHIGHCAGDGGVEHAGLNAGPNALNDSLGPIDLLRVAVDLGRASEVPSRPLPSAPIPALFSASGLGERPERNEGNGRWAEEKEKV